MKKYYIWKILIITSLSLIFILSLSGYLAHIYYLFELTSNFKLQYLLISLLLLIILFKYRNYLLIITATITVLVNISCIIPWYFPDNNIQKNQIIHHSDLRILLSNVDQPNKSYDKVINLIKQEDPDIIVLLEVDEKWGNKLLPLQQYFLYKKMQLQSNFFGIAVFSKIAFDNSDILYIGKSGFPSIVCNFTIQKQPVTLIATHPCSPLGKPNYHYRTDQLVEITNKINQISTSVILIGDLNITMWSPDYLNMIKSTGLLNARKGFGILATWPANYPYLLRIPIDHCLVSQDLQVKDIRLADNIDSDHLPVVIDIGIKKLSGH